MFNFDMSVQEAKDILAAVLNQQYQVDQIKQGHSVFSEISRKLLVEPEAMLSNDVTEFGRSSSDAKW